MSDPLELADLLFKAVEAGDIETIRRDIYGPGFVIWHNFSRGEMGAADNLKMLGWLSANLRGARYEDVVRIAIPGGFIEQHVLRGTLADGTEIDAPTCMIGYVTDGKITRLEEYIDSAQVAAMLNPRATATA